MTVGVGGWFEVEGQVQDNKPRKEKNAKRGNVVFEVVGRQKKVLSRAQRRPAKHSTGSFYEKKEAT